MPSTVISNSSAAAFEESVTERGAVRGIFSNVVSAEDLFPARSDAKTEQVCVPQAVPEYRYTQGIGGLSPLSRSMSHN